MAEITYEEERTRDWDWYACDLHGHIGHFTSAGFRTLPSAVKQGREDAIRLIHFFEEEISERCGTRTRPELQEDCGGWKNAEAQERYVQSFVAAGQRGLFSYDTKTESGPNAFYFLVAIPDRPLRLCDLPPEIGELLQRIIAPLSFADSPHIFEESTLTW